MVSVVGEGWEVVVVVEVVVKEEEAVVVGQQIKGLVCSTVDPADSDGAKPGPSLL